MPSFLLACFNSGGKKQLQYLNEYCQVCMLTVRNEYLYTMV
jgi:hypothetical protein